MQNINIAKEKATPLEFSTYVAFEDSTGGWYAIYFSRSVDESIWCVSFVIVYIDLNWIFDCQIKRYFTPVSNLTMKNYDL